MSFTLHPQLEKDTNPIMNLDLCQLRLMNDRRFLWVLLIPEIMQGTDYTREIHDLATTQQQQLMAEISHVSENLLRYDAVYSKINIAAFGNMVPQLHIHVIARHEQDAAWPGSAIGYESADPYTILHEEMAVINKVNTLIS